MKERQPYTVCNASDLPPGQCKIIEAGKRSIGVFNVAGEFYALLNNCPHEGAELCRGTITGMNAPSGVGEYKWCREGEIIRCPWHGWEFDIKTGRSIFNPHKVRVKSYDVEVEQAQEVEGESVDSFPVRVEDEMVVLYV